MKKKCGLMILVLLCISTIGFSYDFELGGTFIFIPSFDYGHRIGGGVNFSETSYFNDFIGLGFFNDITFLNDITFSPNPSGMGTIRVDHLVSVLFKIMETDKIIVPLGVGVFLDYPVLRFLNEFNIGIGTNVSLYYKLSEKIKLYGRLQGAYTFLHGGEIMFTPCIGVAFAF